MPNFRVHYTLIDPDGVRFPRAATIRNVPDPDAARQSIRNSFAKRLAHGWTIRWNRCKRQKQF